MYMLYVILCIYIHVYMYTYIHRFLIPTFYCFFLHSLVSFSKPRSVFTASRCAVVLQFE